MSDSVKIDCPCCGAKLTLDRSTGDVLSSEAARAAGKTFEEAIGNVRSGGRRREEAFAKAFDKTRRLDDLLEKKFEEAKKKAAEDDSPLRNPMDLD